MRRILTTTTALGLALGLIGCSGSPEQKLLVSAAASLTDVFSEMSIEFERAHADVDVELNFAGSSSLREQILEGAPVDVFASANLSNLDAVADAGLTTGEPLVFAENVLQIAVPVGNPAVITGLRDFADEGLLLGLCADDVPCGDLARQVLARAGVSAIIDTNEPDVRALLTKLELGELDAGIVYATDVAGARGSVEGVTIPPELNVSSEYSIAVIADGSNPSGALAFVAFVTSTEGRAILVDHGFATP